MKYLSKFLSMLLVGAMLYSTGCTDYDADIRDMQQQIDDMRTELIEGEINPLKVDLESLKQALEDAIEAGNAKIAENKAAIDALVATDAEHDEAIQEAKDAIADALTEIAALQGELATLKAELEALEAAHSALDAQHKADIEAVYATINEKVAEVNAAITDAVERISANEDAIETLKDVDAELAADIETALASITLNAEAIAENAENIAENAENIAQNTSDIAALTSRVTANEAAIEALNTGLVNLTNDFASYKAATDAAILTLQGRVDAAEAAIDTLEGDVEELYVLHDNQTLLIENLDGRLEELAQYTQDQLDLLAEADAAIRTLIETVDTKVTNLENSFIDYQRIVNEQFVKAFGEIAENTALINQLSAKHEEDIRSLQAQDAAILQTLDQHAAWLVELEESLAALDQRVGTAEGLIAKIQTNIASMQVTIDALTQDLAELETTLADFQRQMGEQIARIDAAIEQALTDAKAYADEVAAAAVEESKDYADAVMEDLQKRIENEIANLRTQLDQLSAYATSIEQKIDEYIASNNEAIDGLRSDLNELLGRVQSIVFVPEYSDGKGTINYAMLGQTIVEGRSTMVYQVYPAECAAVIANAPAVEGTVAPLSFELEGLLTRGVEPEFNIVGVEGDLNGRLYVTFDARNLGADFYTGKMEYGVSLVLNTETANLSTVYTNVVPTKQADVIEVALVNAQVANDYTIEYTDLEKVVEILPEHDFQFTVNGEGEFTVADMIGDGYAINVTKYDPTYVVTTHDGDTNRNVFKNTLDNTDPYLNMASVSLKEATKLAVGDIETVTYKYDVCGTELTASANVRVTKITREVAMEDVAIVWNYEQDAKSDAGDEPTNSIDALTIATSTLPDDVTYADLLVKNPAITITTGGVAVNNVDVKFARTDAAPTIELVGFEWDKTYEITALYELDSIDVTISVTVNTVDRGREPIVIALDEVAWMLTKDFTNESVYTDSLEPLFDALVASNVNTTKGADEFLEDIFVTNAYTVESNQANGADYTNTMMDINGTEISSIYNIDDFATEIPEKIDYVKEVTLWYGQQVKFTKTLNIGLETVEITLADDTVMLVKDLAFSKDAGSLSEIYDLVGNVDKDSFTTAAEYLDAIFVDNAMRAQVDLANGVTMDNTKLVVSADATEGAAATADYSYVDFSATPESVVYKSTYTTWYGQTIIVNKTINVDWTTYNYDDVEYYVYNIDDEYFSVPKATYLNNPADSQSLFNAYVSINMDYAFNVVDNNGATIAVENLAGLGLTSTFSFAQAPADSDIYFQGGSNILFYQGRDASVRVMGTLVLENSNGVKTVLPTNFDAGQKYANYYVKQYNLVGHLQSKNLNIIISKSEAKTYTYYLMNQLTLQDVRGFDLIQHGELVKDTDVEVTWSNANWTEGDDTNGFATTYGAAGIYGLHNPIYRLSIPEQLQSVLTFEEATGKLVYNNDNALTETKTVELNVNVIVGHIWQQETTSFNITLTITE